jgi:hypothetical protein
VRRCTDERDFCPKDILEVANNNIKAVSVLNILI